MNIVLFSHPSFLPSQSMPRYARMLADAYCERGHQVVVWAPQPLFHRLLAGTRLAKWAGYIDQYLVFPMQVRWRLLSQPKGQLYVFCDQALGPWVPLVKHLPHVVHAHDLLALRSALGLIPENPTSHTGQIYQRYIRKGFQQAQRFIAVSTRTQEDLHEHAGVSLDKITVVFNGLNQPLAPMAFDQAHPLLQRAGLPAEAAGFLLHLGGSQWYKNTLGVVKLYQHYLSQLPASERQPLPLVMVCPPPSQAVQHALNQLPAGARVHFCQGIDSSTLRAVYSMARVFLFPSLAEGFGWPIVESQACGTVVLTTDDSPMNEIGGPAAQYLPRLQHGQDLDAWARRGASKILQILHWTPQERSSRVDQGLTWGHQFDGDQAIEGYLRVYHRIMQASQPVAV
jgi:glycosyltransferase involved in cell wall biosynthesis